MSRATPQMRELAARLIAAEMKGKDATTLPSAAQVCEKLRPHLATLMGKAGFRAVLARALAVSSVEVPGLAEVQVNVEGVLTGWDRVEAKVDAKELAEAGVLLVAQMLGLLAAFIGENLTLRLVREVWPALSVEDLNFTTDHP